jgi:putative oxidoreductase
MASPSAVVAKWISATPALRSVLRIVAAFMFTLAGTGKLFGFPASHGGAAAPMTQAWVAGVLEAFGGVLLLFGLFTRPVAFIVAGEMAVAYFQVHFPRSFWPTVNGGVSAALYCFIWLYISAAGPGPWSIDSVRGSRDSR